MKHASYDPKEIEPKWQKYWEEQGLFHAKTGSKKKKFYGLVEFPYPSGDGLHTGHVRGYTAMDVIARKRRHEGFEVLYPIGWDAFGLPTENFAIKHGVRPEVVTKKNTDNFRRQMQSLGFSFDWSREINTTDPEYYKWTQWIFLQLFKKGLAYKQKMEINWCPSCKIGLANEEAQGGVCERCGGPTEKKEKEQWMLAITKYADRLDKDLDSVNYLDKIKVQQRNWIGRSEGALVKFKISSSSHPHQDESSSRLEDRERYIEVFTTRVDTIFGCTYVVVAPEHHIIAHLLQCHSREGGNPGSANILDPRVKPEDDSLLLVENAEKIREYIEEVKKKSEEDRLDATKEKTGVKLEGIEAVNPFTGESVPVFVADYVLGNYGTGAVMAVPAHDERDWEFAKKYRLPLKSVVIPSVVNQKNLPVPGKSVVFRETISAIVYDPKKNKYLALKWKKNDWTTFVIGGVEQGEDVIDAAKREVREETGYTDLKYIRTLGGPVEAKYFVSHKDENRMAHIHAVLFELESEDRISVSEEEKEKHPTIWIEESSLSPDVMFDVDAPFWFARLKSEENEVVTESGVLIESGEFSGLKSEEAREKMIQWLEEKGLGKKQTNYKLRDWVFSRQRYWGEPIPLVKCDACGWVPVSEDELPVELPRVESYTPTDTGESPLSAMEEWVATKCPKCGGPAQRETDTMPNWAGSSWYFLRYADPENTKALASKSALEYWTPVDWYNGGMEHTTLHLLYSRFWHKFLYDIGVVPTSEPYQKRTSHGLILAEGGVKMSKSKGNVVNPDDIVRRFGADTLRVYEMFMGPFDQNVAWSTESIAGSRRFLEKVWKLGIGMKNQETGRKKEDAHAGNVSVKTLLHKTIKKVSEDIEAMRFNTAISALMILVNEMEKTESMSREDFETLLVLLSPFAPHVAEELWSLVGNAGSILSTKWPEANPKYLVADEVEVVVQVNGKLRARLRIVSGSTREEVESAARADLLVSKHLDGKEVRKTVFVQDRLVNFVVG
ncbi:MAG: class I tRNA ligase family protein [Candidatus Moraniibacteriota bacterium]|nr:MAG: class I tRNA ligase family protein [Candidatus Moranbacteria bacterium]